MQRIALLAGGTLALSLMSAQQADAATDAGTSVTFQVNTGALAITAPATFSLGAGASGTTLTARFPVDGPVQVNDPRGLTPAPWTATVTSTVFTGTGGTPPTIPASAASYSPGAATLTEGDGTFTPGAGGALDTTTPVTAFTHTGGTGSNLAEWRPTLTVRIPGNAVADTYTGTMTHSVTTP